MSFALDNAAESALWMLSRQLSPKSEHIGALYRDGDEISRTAPTGGGEDSHVHGSLAVPRGSLLALFHNHPAMGSNDADRATFSRDDRQQAQMLKVPSYISAGDRTLRFDPATGKTDDVLAEFPWTDYKQYLDQRFPQMADTMQHSPAITAAQRAAMVNAVEQQANHGTPGAAPPMPMPPQMPPRPHAMDMGGAPNPLPPGMNSFGPPMGAPPPQPPTAMELEMQRRAAVAEMIRKAAMNGAPK